jgi:hypothetical protein
MDKTALVEKYIEDGKKLINGLDEKGFRLDAALWFYLTDSDEWRLLLASPFVEKEGPRKSYNVIQSVLEGLSPPSAISLKDISIVSPNYNLIQLLKIAIRTGPGISDIRFTRNVINNTLIEDAYIYRIL